MGIISQTADEAGTQWIVNDIPCGCAHIFFFSQRVIVEAVLPDLAAQTVGGYRLDCLDHQRKVTGAGEFEQPVKVIGHDHERQCVCIAALLFVLQ